MGKNVKCHVEKGNDIGLWVNIRGSEGTKQFCLGWVMAMDSCYPSSPYRIIETHYNGSISIWRKTKGRGAVHLN